jgi:phage tail sheath protein FI
MAKSKKRGKKRTGGSYLTPGVYLEEVSSGSRPIEAVGTAVAAFVGFAKRRPVSAVVTVMAALAAVVGAVRAIRD